MSRDDVEWILVILHDSPRIFLAWHHHRPKIVCETTDTVGSTRFSSSVSNHSARPNPAWQFQWLTSRALDELSSNCCIRTKFGPGHLSSSSLRVSQILHRLSTWHREAVTPLWYRDLHADLCWFLCHDLEHSNSLHQNHHSSGKIPLKVALMLLITYLDQRSPEAGFPIGDYLLVRKLIHSRHANISLCLVFILPFVNEVD